MEGSGGSGRAGLAGALAVLACCALSACGSAAGPGAVPAAAAAATTQSPAPHSSATRSPTTPVAPNPSPSTCPVANQQLVEVDAIGTDSRNGLHFLAAAPAQRYCGPGVPDDSYISPIGKPAVFEVAKTVTILLLDMDTGKEDSVTWAKFAAGDIDEYGGDYGITVDSAGLVVRIEELYHP